MQNISITGSSALYVVALLLGGASFAGLVHFAHDGAVVAGCWAGLAAALGIFGTAVRAMIRSLQASSR